MSNISKPVNKVYDIILSYGFYIIFLILFLFFSLTTKFFSVFNIAHIFLDASALMIIGAGLTFVILTGCLDLSIGSVAAVCAVAGILLNEIGIPVYLAMLLAVFFGAIIGCINATIIVVFNVNPLLTTLGMMIGLRGLALTISNGGQYAAPRELVDSLLINIGGFLPLMVIIIIFMMIVLQLILSKTIFGRNVIAVGSNPSAAQQLGINVRAIKFVTFIISSICAAIGGIVSMTNIGMASQKLGQGMEFIAIAAVVIGGTSLFGGRGSIIPGTMFGALLLNMIQSGMGLMGLSPFAYPFVQGLIIFIAMLADSFKKEYRAGL